MTTQCTGILYDSGGNIAINTPIKLITTQGGGTGTFKTAEYETRTDSSGNYDFTIGVGIHTVYIRYVDDYEVIGSITVNTETTSPITLDTLLYSSEPLTPEEIAQMQELLSQATQAASDAANSAVEAQQYASRALAWGGYFTPTYDNEYPTNMDGLDTQYIIKVGDSVDNSYTYTTGELSGTTVRNGYTLIYDITNDNLSEWVALPYNFGGVLTIDGEEPDNLGDISGVSRTEDSWRINFKKVGSTLVEDTLANYTETGWYHSQSASNLWSDLPEGYNGAFTCQVTSISNTGQYYRQRIQSYRDDFGTYERNYNYNSELTDWVCVEPPLKAQYAGEIDATKILTSGSISGVSNIILNRVFITSQPSGTSVTLGFWFELSVDEFNSQSDAGINIQFDISAILFDLSILRVDYILSSPFIAAAYAQLDQESGDVDPVLVRCQFNTNNNIISMYNSQINSGDMDRNNAICNGIKLYGQISIGNVVYG